MLQVPDVRQLVKRKEKEKGKLQLEPGLGGAIPWAAPRGSSSSVAGCRGEAERGGLHPKRLGDAEPPSPGSVSRAKRGKTTHTVPKSWISRKTQSYFKLRWARKGWEAGLGGWEAVGEVLRKGRSGCLSARIR